MVSSVRSMTPDSEWEGRSVLVKKEGHIHFHIHFPDGATIPSFLPAFVVENPAFLHKYVFMRTTIDLPDPLFRELKTASAQRGVKLKALVTELLQKGLARRDEPGGPGIRSPLPLIRKATGSSRPALTNREIEDILTTEDGDA